MRLAEPGDLTRPTQAVGVSQRHEATRAPAGLGAGLSRTHARRTPSNRKPALAAHRREEGRESIFHIRLLGLGLAVCRHGEFSRAAGVDSDYWARAIALSEHSRERDVLLPQVFLCRRSLMPTDTVRPVGIWPHPALQLVLLKPGLPGGFCRGCAARRAAIEGAHRWMRRARSSRPAIFG